MRVVLQQAFVLHRRPYRDSSLLLEAFSRDHGRVGLVAKGARRASRTRPAAALQTLAPLLLSWTGRGDLVTLTAVETAASAPPLDGRRLLCALYLNELLVRLLARFDPHPTLYADYQHTLAALAEPQTAPAPLLRRFEKRLLDALGYGLLLTHCVASRRPVRAEGRYFYHLERGPLELTGGDDPLGGEREPDGAAAGVVISGRCLLALADERLADPQLARESLALLRAAIDQQLDGKPLQTRALLHRRRPNGPANHGAVDDRQANAG